jgi:hypothetical protein
VISVSGAYPCTTFRACIAMQLSGAESRERGRDAERCRRSCGAGEGADNVLEETDIGLKARDAVDGIKRVPIQRSVRARNPCPRPRTPRHLGPFRTMAGISGPAP